MVAVSRDSTHRFSKLPQPGITLVEGMGVAGDAHAGALVQHRSRVRRDPHQPNLRQVHLLQSELFDEVAARGHALRPGDLGENILTSGIDLLALPAGTRLTFGTSEGPVVRVTGLRNPCRQIEAFRTGLLRLVVARADGVRTRAEPTLTATGGVDTLDGSAVVRKAGVMGVVEWGGTVAPGQAVVVELPATPHTPLVPV